MTDWLHLKSTSLLATVGDRIAEADASSAPERIHQLRTAIRRLREVLRVFSDFYKGHKIEVLRKELRDLMHLAAEIRNRDITLDLIESSDVPAVRLRSALQDDREKFVGNLRTQSLKLRSKGLGGFVFKLRATEQTPEALADTLLPKLHRKYLRAATKLQGKHLDFEALHRFRLKTKRYRYTLELFRDLPLQPSADARIERLKPVQDLLGEINDCATALDLIGGTSGKHPRVAQFLHERAAKKIAKLDAALDSYNLARGPAPKLLRGARSTPAADRQSPRRGDPGRTNPSRGAAAQRPTHRGDAASSRTLPPSS